MKLALKGGKSNEPYLPMEEVITCMVKVIDTNLLRTNDKIWDECTCSEIMPDYNTFPRQFWRFQHNMAKENRK